MDRGCLVEGERKFGDSWPGGLGKTAMVTSYKSTKLSSKWKALHTLQVQVSSACDITWISVFPFPFQYFPNSRSNLGKKGGK